MSEQTISAESWSVLASRMHDRAMDGDAAAIRFCERHKPVDAGGDGGMPSINYLSGVDLSKMSVEQLRALAGEDTDVLVQTWKALLCVDCRIKLLERIEAEQAAPDAKVAEQVQAQARRHVAETYDLSEPPAEIEPAG